MTTQYPTENLDFQIVNSKFGNDDVSCIKATYKETNRSVAYVKFHELKDSYEEYWNFISEPEFKTFIKYKNYISLDGISTHKSWRNKGIGRLMMQIFIKYVETKFPHIPAILLEIDSFDGTKKDEELQIFYSFFGFEMITGYKNVMIKILNGETLPTGNVMKVQTPKSYDTSFQPGAKVKIIANTRGHEFEIGEDVTIIEQVEDTDSWIAENYMGERWSIAEHEAEIVEDSFDKQQSLRERRKIDPFRK